MTSLEDFDVVDTAPDEVILGTPEGTIVSIVETFYDLHNQGAPFEEAIEFIEFHRNLHIPSPQADLSFKSLNSYVTYRIRLEYTTGIQLHSTDIAYTINEAEKQFGPPLPAEFLIPVCKSAWETIYAIIYSPRTPDQMLNDLRPYIKLGDNPEDVERRCDLKFSTYNMRHLIPGNRELVNKEAGIWVSSAKGYGIHNIVRLDAVINGLPYPMLRIGNKPLPDYYPHATKEEAEANAKLLSDGMRQAKLRNMSFFDRIMAQITGKG